MFYNSVRNIAWFFLRCIFFFSTENLSEIPKVGGGIVCANHRSLWDAVCVCAAVKRPIAYIAKEELFKNKIVAFVLKKMNCHPVKRDGKDISAVKTAVSLLKKGELVVVFPEGERIRKGKKPNIKSGALRLAVMGGVPVFPLAIRGNFKLFQKVKLFALKKVDTSLYRTKKYTDEEYKHDMEEIMKTIYKVAETEHLIHD